MAKNNKQLLEELSQDAADARDDMGSAKTGIRRKGDTGIEDDSDTEDDFEEEESEQDIDTDENEEENDPDEEPKDDDDAEEEQPQDRVPNSVAAQRRIDAKKDADYAELQAKLAKYEEAETKAEQKSLEDEITSIAEELNLDAPGLNKIASVLGKHLLEQISAKLPPQAVVEDFENRQEDAYFDTEWRGFIPELAKQYPRASAAQLEQARSLMDELSHSEDGGEKVIGKNGKPRLMPYSLKYIMFNNQDDFSKILSNSRRHGLESANIASYDVGDGEPDLTTSKGIDAMDKLYRNAESESSGLRRGRSPRSRSI